MKSQEVRKKFLEFFESKGHQVLKSAPLVPEDDPTILWINAGMTPLKKYFKGVVVPENPRMTSSQKCIRTNDIENVGKTARHQTMFEMLGNFSIGDYFKQEAISWAWEFLTEHLGFDKERLFVTVHTEDNEAYSIWNEQIGIPKEKICRTSDDNFWDIGEGPCGPCSEIFFDRNPSLGEDEIFHPDNHNGERYLEVWNLVFSQFNHNPDGSYTELPKKNIDTGAGLERICSLLQGVETNFDTDLFQPIIKATEELTNKKYGENKKDDIAFKVIADHVRSASFAISDGQEPSNDGRGYVIRRLIRRASRYGKTLGMNGSFLYKLVPIVGEIMGDAYPEVVENQHHIQTILQFEEEKFKNILSSGEKMLQKMLKNLQSEGKTVLTGDQVFKLNDTFGFPVDLTEEICEENGVTVDREGFEEELEAQRERARLARK